MQTNKIKDMSPEEIEKERRLIENELQRERRLQDLGRSEVSDPSPVSTQSQSKLSR